jgi:putative drug exporter of the RND superfamily
MAHALFRLAHACVRRRRWVVIGWLVVLIGAVGLASAYSGEKSSDFAIPGTESQEALDLLDERFPAQAGSTATVVFAAPAGRTLADLDAAAAIDATLAAAADAPQVIAVGDPVEEGALSPDQTIGFAEVRYGVDADEVTDEAVVALKATADAARDVGLQVEFRGDVITVHTTAGESEGGHTAELIGLGVAVVVLLFAFGSVLAAFTPIVTGLVGVGITLMVLDIAARWWDVNQFGPTLAMMIGLAVGIDYALFIVSRHRQQLRLGMDVTDSIARACGTAGSAVLFAGITVVIAISGLAVVRIPLLTSMGLSAAVAVVIAVALALTLLPALLGMIGTRIDAFALPGMKPKVEIDAGAHHTSGPLARRRCGGDGRARCTGAVDAVGHPRRQLALDLEDGAPRLRPAHHGVRRGLQRSVHGRRRPVRYRRVAAVGHGGADRRLARIGGGHRVRIAGCSERCR